MKRARHAARDAEFAALGAINMTPSEWRMHRFGRITGGELERLLAVFEEVWKEREEFSSLRESPGNWAVSFDRLASVPNWVTYYEVSLSQLVGELISRTGVAEQFIAAANGGVDSLLTFVDTLPDLPPPSEESLPVAMAMIGNLEAISLYSRTINDMVAAAKEGDVLALSQAISVDAYVVCFRFFLAGMRLGQFMGDAEFASGVMRAISGPHKRRHEYAKLRWAEYLLRDQGGFEVCSREEIYSLIVEHLRLYDPVGDKKDPKAGLFSLFRKWQKQAGIQNPGFGFSGKKKV